MRADGKTPPETYIVAHPGAELFGSDRMMLETVQGLTEAGARVVVALPEDGPLVSAVRTAGAEVVILPMLVLRKALLRPSGWITLLRNTLRGAGAAWRLLSRVRPSAVYTSTITIPQWPLIARVRRIPSLTHVHEAEASASRIVNLALYAPHLTASSVAVNSEFSLRTLRATLPRLGRRARVVYNGVAGPATPAPARDALDTLRVLYVGRLSPRKGVEDAIEAVGRLRASGLPATLTVLGSVFTGYEWFEQELHARSAELGDGAVEFLGFRPDVWSVIADHDVLVVPSRVDEPFGNTAVEGILAHRPVVASDTSGLREAAGGYPTTRLVAPGSPEALADALRGVAADWDTVRAEVAGSAAQAVARHAPEIYRASIRDALAALAPSARAQRSDV